MLHDAPYLLFNSGTLVGINKRASAIARGVTRCHVSVAMSTLNFVRKFQQLESFDVAVVL